MASAFPHYSHVHFPATHSAWLGAVSCHPLRPNHSQRGPMRRRWPSPRHPLNPYILVQSTDSSLDSALAQLIINSND